MNFSSITGILVVDDHFAVREGLRLYREDVPHVPLHHQMIPWALRANLTIPHAANNQPYFRWAVVN